MTFLLFLGPQASVPGQSVNQEPTTNLQVFQALAGTIGDRLAEILPQGDSLSLSVNPADIAWTVENDLAGALLRKGKTLLSGGVTAPVHVSVAITNARVAYAQARREGFMGSRIVDREVLLTLRAKVAGQRDRGDLVLREWTERHADVVELSRIESLENPGLPITRGVVPAEGFFSGVAEPLIVIGAIGVAVFLLFAIRS